MKKAIASLVFALATTSAPLAFGEDIVPPPPIPRPPDVVQLGFTPDGNPIYGSAPGSANAPIAQPTNPAPIPRPEGVRQIGTTPEGYPIYGALAPGVPPPLFNPDGTLYGGAPVFTIPGATKDAPFGFTRDGKPVPPPLYNEDGTKFVLGVSPIPTPKPIVGAPFGYSALGTPVPPPQWNPDGTPYVHGLSPMPVIPANLRQPIVVTNASAQLLVNNEIMAADITAVKKKRGYLLDTESQISYIDKSLTITAIKKGAKAKTLTLGTDTNGDLFIPTTANLKGYTIQIKRGDVVLKKLKG